MRLLVTIEDTFEIRARGLLVLPTLDEREARPNRFELELRKPSGETVRAMAYLQVPFISPRPPELRAQLMILGVSKMDVPIGTELWIDAVAKPTDQPG